MNGAAGVIGSTVLYGIGITALQHYNYELRCYPSLKSTKHAAHGATISAPIALDTRSSVFQGAILAGLRGLTPNSVQRHQAQQKTVKPCSTAQLTVPQSEQD